jgi:hypothetical protein
MITTSNYRAIHQYQKKVQIPKNEKLRKIWAQDSHFKGIS